MKAFYEAVISAMEKTENKALFTNREIQPILYIDLFAGQYFTEENYELFAQNALLVDWNIDYTDNTGIVTIDIHCCYEQLRFTSNISQNRAIGLKFLDYIELIDVIMRTIETSHTGKLQLIREGFQKMDSIVDVYLLTYQCSYTDINNNKKYQKGDIENLSLQENLVKEIRHNYPTHEIDYGI